MRTIQNHPSFLQADKRMFVLFHPNPMSTRKGDEFALETTGSPRAIPFPQRVQILGRVLVWFG